MCQILYTNLELGGLMTRVLGTDTSHWSGTINFETMYNAGARFWYTKATDADKYSGWQWEDSKFDKFSTDAFHHGKLLAGCYHWLQPSVDPTVAAKFYLERYKRFPFHLPPIMDFEEPLVLQTRKFSDYAWRAQVWLEYVKHQTGRVPFIYTAKWYTEQFDDKLLSWMKAYPVIIADYTCWSNTFKYLWCKEPRRKPYPWLDDWSMWQFSADGNGRGHEFGVSAGNICLDYWHNDMNSLLAFLGLDEQPTPPVEEPEEPGQPPEEVSMSQKKFYVIGYEQNVRSEPIIGNNVVKVIPQNTEIYPIIDIKFYDKRNIWLKYPDGWVALLHIGGQYLRQEKQ